MAYLALHFLGPLHVTCNGSPISFAYDKVPALLAFLAVESYRPHARETLAELFWPDRPSATSRHSLSQALTSLRQATTDSNCLALTRETVQFKPQNDCSLDVVEFVQLLETSDHHSHPNIETCPDCAARLEQALTLYRGDFLSQFSIANSAAFEDWVALQREGFHRRAVRALTQLRSYYESQSDLKRALELVRRQLELDSWEESTHRHLMRLLALDGQRSTALAQYERCRAILETELGITPDAETELLVQQIRAGEIISRNRPITPTQMSANPVLRHNLPAQSTPFIGREKELTQLSALLNNRAGRIITLVGPGGIGKTRLAIQVALGQLTNFSQGVWFVSLAPLASPDLIAPAIAEALAFTPYETEALPAQLLRFLRDREVLLVLDNFEHLLAGARWIAELIESAPQATLLITSRARLNLRGEWAIEVEGLSVPTNLEAENVEDYGAVQLFTQSARRVRSSFELRAENRQHVVRICQLVSGMPLGIELAAAWLPVLSSAEIAREITLSLDFLAAELRDVSERHRSMRAVFDHSWRLLTDPERRAFRRLSVFRGGFTREAAEAVASATLVDLSRLAAKSLLHRTPSGRFEVHELLRQYGAINLRERPDEEQETCEQHGQYYLTFLAIREAPLKGFGQPAALAEVAGELENIRAAWEWAARECHATLIAQSINGLFLFTEVRGRYSEAERQFRLAAEALERAPADLPDRALALGKTIAVAGSWHMRLGDPERLRVMGAESLALLRPLNARQEIAFTLNMVAGAAHVQGAYADERGFLQESIALGRECGDHWITGYSLNDLGLLMFILGDAAEAKRLSGEALAIFTDIGDQRGRAFAFNNLGVIAGQFGDYEEADRLLREGLALWRAFDHRWGIANTLIHLGATARARHDLQASRACFLEAVQTAMAVRTWPLVLDALVELATLAIEEGDSAQAQDIIQAVLHHPARTATTQAKAERLRSELNLSLESSSAEVETLVAALLKASTSATL